MDTKNQPSHPSLPSRREFLKNASLAAASVAAVNFPSLLHAQAKQPINAVVIGVGGRGGGAGTDFLQAAKNVGVEAKIVAVADIFPGQAKRGKEAFGVPEDKCFSGFDAYMKAINEPGVNYVIIATPPGLVEISAEPLYYREKRQVLNEFQDQLPFTFTDEDKISPPKPEIGGGAVPTRGSLPPRPPQLAGKLSGADLAGITGQESWRCMLIGIADYRRAGASHPDLGTPTNDVLNLKALLEQQYGFESSTVLLNGQATMQGIRKGFWELHKACQPNDNVLIFYAGHGTLAPNGAGQWVCADGTELSNAEIKDVIQRLPARRVLLICPDCRRISRPSGKFPMEQCCLSNTA